MASDSKAKRGTTNECRIRQGGEIEVIHPLRRQHARTRHISLVPPFLNLNDTRPGACPSCGSLDGLR